jgi:hypothetical protein
MKVLAASFLPPSFRLGQLRPAEGPECADGSPTETL